MKNYLFKIAFLFASMALLFSMNTFGQRQMENLNRGVVAVRTSSSQVFVSWRMLGTEYGQNATFNLYRGTTQIASNLSTTNYVDNTSTTSTYSVSAVIGGSEQTRSSAASVWSNFYTTVSISPPSGGTTPDGVSFTYTANDCSVGDLDGDGDLEFILKWDPTNSKDNSQSGYTGNVYLDGVEMNGTRLWRINLGINIRAGAHYTQFMVYDLDGDGKAEVACKTAPGSRSGTGSYLSNGPAASDNDATDYRNSSGYILTGPEYLTIFNGQTGAELATTNYIPARGTVSDWGDSYGNRVDRFLACIAYLDGTKPSLVMCRGYYTRTVLAAWNYRNGSLSHQWTFDTNNGYSSYAGQGNHNLSVADVDSDGKDEIIYGSMAVNDNGAGLWTTGLGHGDALHVSDINTGRSGLEVWGIHEGTSTPGSALLDARTGAILWQTANADVGRGVSADLTSSYSGMECWGGTDGLRSATNSSVGTAPTTSNFVIWWDGDLSRELCDADRIDKWVNGSSNRLVTIYNYESSSTNNSTKKNPCLQADILGDWREELITRSSDNTKLIIFTTTSTTSTRMYTLLHDPAYRLGVAWQNVGYNQPPHTGFFFGNGMSSAPVPNITLVGGSAPCTPTAITPYVQINGGSWTQATSVSVTVGDEVKFGPQPASGGSWSWSGPSGFSASTREVTISNIQTNQAGNYVATYTNTCGAQSNATFSVSVSGGTTGTTITIQENQTGFCGVDGTVDNNNSGYTGDGFANTSNASGNGVDYKVTFSSSGSYTFTFRYASTSDRPGRLIINGSTVISSISFPSTSSWTTWSTVSATASVSAGTFDVRIEATGTSGLGNIDYMQVTGTTPSAASCSSTPVTYTLSTSVSGQGSISPSGGTYEAGTSITLTATPSSGWQFTSWSGALSGSTNPANLTINSNVSVTATFTQITTPVTITIQENTTGFCSVDGTVDNNNAGFTGTGFANTSNSSGMGITWSINVPSSGSYTLVWRYANGSTTDRTGQVMVDGNTVISNVSFSGTGAWTTWTNTSGNSVSLSAGTRLLRLQATNSAGLANIDYITVTGINPTPVSCTGQKSIAIESELSENNSEPAFKLYPNPVNQLLNIELDNEMAEGAFIQLFDNTGRMLVNYKVTGSEHQIYMGDFVSGIYLLKVSNNYQSINKRVVKN